jgi:hypothetical protein
MADGMKLNEHAKRLLEWQPQAIDIRAAGKCHCGAGGMLFYALPGMDRTHRYIASKNHNPANAQDEQGRFIDTSKIDGGYFCASCGFSNAGAMRRAQYKAAEVYTPEEAEASAKERLRSKISHIAENFPSD